ncbi:GNAT family N-acetyltransferase [Streptomyces sp. NPDC054794]
MPCWPTEAPFVYRRRVRRIVRVQRLYEEMSPQNRRLRFFPANPASARLAAERVARGERPGYRAPAAECDGQLVGLAEYEALPDGCAADISVAVADGRHHRGVATLLLTAGVTAFLDTAALLYAQPLPHGRRVAIVSNAGGAGVLASDACVDTGLVVPRAT